MKTETSMRVVRSVCMAGAVLGPMLLASVALAGPPDAPADTPRGTSETRIVKYADLDLTRPADVARLYQRIEDTAKRVCTPLGDVVADDACLGDALQRTIAKIGLPALTQVYMAKLRQIERQLNGTRMPADRNSPIGRSAPVSMNDLDLPSAQGQAIARQCVNEKASTLCSQLSDPLDLEHTAHYLACVSEATEQAMLQLDHADAAQADPNRVNGFPILTVSK
jgi:UrcA family protein